MSCYRCSKSVVLILIVGICVLSHGCGSSTTASVTAPTPSPPSSQPPSVASSTPEGILLIRSTPTSDLTVLSFSVTVSQVMLEPGNVSLLAKPVSIELHRLQVEPSLLAAIPLPTGTYSALTLSFSDAKLTTLNSSGETSGACNTSAICNYSPSLTATSVTLTGQPFPIVSTDDGPPTLLLDFNLAQSLSGSTDVTPVLSLQQLTAANINAVDASAKQAVGSITYTGGDDIVDGAWLNLVTTSGTIFHIDDSSTDYIDGSLCGLTYCVQDRLAESDLKFSIAGLSPSATRIILKPDGPPEVEGIITAVDSASQFDMVVLHQAPAANGLAVGAPLRVNLQSGALIELVDTDPHKEGITGLTFQSPRDLSVGQVVSVRAQSTPIGTPLALDADRVRLKSVALTGRVQSVHGTNQLTVDHVPANFATTQVEVMLALNSNFDGISSLSNLAANDTVSVSGFLFKTPGGPVLLLEGIRKR